MNSLQSSKLHLFVCLFGGVRHATTQVKGLVFLFNHVGSRDGTWGIRPQQAPLPSEPAHWPSASLLISTLWSVMNLCSIHFLMEKQNKIFPWPKLIAALTWQAFEGNSGGKSCLLSQTTAVASPLRPPQSYGLDHVYNTKCEFPLMCRALIQSRYSIKYRLQNSKHKLMRINNSRDWRERSAAESPFCSYGGSRFCFQHTHQVAHNPL